MNDHCEQPNPYAAPLGELAEPKPANTDNRFARIATIVYGLIVTATTLLSIFDVSNTGRTWAWAFVKLALYAPACFGIFGIAFARLQFERLTDFWKYYAQVLPVLVIAFAVVTNFGVFVNAATAIFLYPMFVANFRFRECLIWRWESNREDDSPV